VENVDLSLLGEQVERRQSDMLMRDDMFDVRSRLEGVDTLLESVTSHLDQLGGAVADLNTKVADLNTKVDLVHDGMDRGFAMLREALGPRNR